MAEADDKLDFCKQALGELGTRSTITSLDPPDGSQEAYYCNLFFNGTRDQILRAAHWGFAGYTDTPVLWKAAPGTPENPSTPENYVWSVRDPARPWKYSYVYPYGDIVQIRRIRSQPQQNGGMPSMPFSGFTDAGDACYPFEIATDLFDGAGNYLPLTKGMAVPTIVSAGAGYRSGDFITLTGGGGVYANPAILRVVLTDPAVGAVLTAFSFTFGSYTTPASGTMTQLETTGAGAGFTCTGLFIERRTIKVILTDAPNAIYDGTTALVEVAAYDPLFADAFMLALEGKLALALIGDRALYAAKLQEANAAIINARVRDGNEGLTVYDGVPDWMQARGISAAGGPSGWYNPPYGPLFAV